MKEQMKIILFLSAIIGLSLLMCRVEGKSIDQLVDPLLSSKRHDQNGFEYNEPEYGKAMMEPNTERESSYSKIKITEPDTAPSASVCVDKPPIKVFSHQRHSEKVLQLLIQFIKQYESFQEMTILDRITESRTTSYRIKVKDGSTLKYPFVVVLKDKHLFLKDKPSKRISASSLLSSASSSSSSPSSSSKIELIDAATGKPFAKRSPPIALNSTRGMEILMDTWKFYPKQFQHYLTLSNSYATQSLTTVCGLASLANVFNALHVTPVPLVSRLSPYPFWTDDAFFNNTNIRNATSCVEDHHIYFDRIRHVGLAFHEAYQIGKCFSNSDSSIHLNGEYASEMNSVDDFRNRFAKAMLRESDDASYLIINYARQAVGQAGGGHFSPIGLFNPHYDMLLVMDTARFKYPPVFLPLETVFESMLEIDPGSKKSRGVFLVSQQS